MLPQEQQRGAYFYIHPPALKERKKIKEPKGVREMGNHSKGVFTFLNLTPLSIFVHNFPLWLLLWLCKNRSHIPLIYIHKCQKKKIYKRAVILKGITALFLLEFFSYISIYYNGFLLKQIAEIWEKPCFSPGCRSPPLPFDFEFIF